jgi:hypothetical protein
LVKQRVRITCHPNMMRHLAREQEFTILDKLRLPGGWEFWVESDGEPEWPPAVQVLSYVGQPIKRLWWVPRWAKRARRSLLRAVGRSRPVGA